jgi:hypothetical protein
MHSQPFAVNASQHPSITPAASSRLRLLLAAMFIHLCLDRLMALWQWSG